MFPIAFVTSLLCIAPQQQDAGLSVRMTICSAAGKPLAGAVAGVGEGEFTSEQVAAQPGAKADAQGRLEITVPADRRGLKLVVAAANFTTLEVPVPAKKEGPLDLGLVILFPGVERTGRVRDEQGRPLAGVRVRASDPFQQFDAGGSYASSALSDERGMFRLRGSPPGSVEMTFTKWGHHGQALYPVRGETPLAVALHPAAVTTGTIVGVPADARIDLVAECPDAATCAARRAVDGSFEVLAPARGRYRVVAEHGGRRVATSELLDGEATGVTLAPANAAHDLEVRITIGNKPAPGFWILDSWSTNDDLEIETNQFPPPLQGRHVNGDAVTLSVPAWVTRAYLLLGAEGAVTRRIVLFDASVTERKYDLDPAGSIVGRAIDAVTKQPLAGVRYLAVPPDHGTVDMADAPCVTGADGRFRIEGLREGRHFVHLDHPERELTEAIEAPITGVAAHDLGEVVLTAAPSGLRGRFADQALPPIAWVCSLGAAGGSGIRCGNYCEPAIPTSRTLVDPITGSFTLSCGRNQQILTFVVPPPTAAGPALVFSLGTAEPQLQPQRFAVPPPLSVIRGTVRLNGPRQPMSLRVVARAERALQPVAAVEVDSGGGYELWLPEGTWQLNVVDMTTGITLLAIDDSVTLRAGDTAQRDFEPVLREITLHLEPEAVGGPMLASELLVCCHRMADTGLYDPRRIRLTPGEVDVRLWLPPGDYTASIGLGGVVGEPRADSDSPYVGNAEFPVGTDSSARIAVKVQPPPVGARFR